MVDRKWYIDNNLEGKKMHESESWRKAETIKQHNIMWGRLELYRELWANQGKNWGWFQKIRLKKV